MLTAHLKKSKLTAKSIVVVLAMCTLFGFTPKVESNTVKLKLNGIKENGTLYISMCSEASQWTDDGIYSFDFKVDKLGSQTFELNNIQSGDYAIALYLDVNGNKELDTNFFGIPKEPYAFSNNIKPKFSTPDFDECRFSISTDNEIVSITLID